MPTFDSLKIDNAQYDVDLHSATFVYPLGESKGFCKAMTIPGFYGNWNNRQFFFVLYGRHCPCALYLVKYQAGGSATINDANFEITCYGNFYGSSKTDVIFQKEQAGDYFVLNIWLNCYDFGNLSMWIAPRDITVYDYSSAEWVTAGDIQNQIPVKFPIDSDGGTINGNLTVNGASTFNVSAGNEVILNQTGAVSWDAFKIESTTDDEVGISFYNKAAEKRLAFGIPAYNQLPGYKLAVFDGSNSYGYGNVWLALATEKWVNDNFLSKTSVSVSGNTLKIS